MLFGKSQKAGDRAKWIWVIVCSSLLMSGCESDKLAQCDRIFMIVRDVNQSNQDLSSLDDGQSLEMKSWLQAANQFSQAADMLKDLEIERRELMEYQHRLARIYRIYAQTTYDAVRAQENKDLTALESARQDAEKAGVLQRQVIQEINSYCVRSE